MLALVLVAGIQGAACSPPRHSMCDLVEQRLRNSVEGTAFRPGACESYPGVMASSAVAQGVLDCFQDMDLSEDDVLQWRTSFSGAHLDSALAKIQVYWGRRYHSRSQHH